MPVGEARRSYVVCPICGHVFRATYASTYVTVGREADLCPKIPGRPSDGARLIRSAVTMCPACSFAAGEAFDDLDLTFEERYGIEERLKEDGLLKVFRKGQPPWLGFHAAEVCGKERSLRSRELPASLVTCACAPPGSAARKGSGPSRAPSSSGLSATSCAPSRRTTSSDASSR
jgi:hypothetical protein